MARIIGINQAIRKMKNRADAFSGRNPKIYTGISQDAALSIKKNFDAQGRPKWQKRKRTYSHPILDKTGTMRDNAESSVHRWYFQGQTYIMKVLSTEYGIYHQYGTSKLPIRAFVLFQPNELVKMQQRFNTAFLKGR